MRVLNNFYDGSNINTLIVNLDEFYSPKIDKPIRSFAMNRLSIVMDVR